MTIYYVRKNGNDTTGDGSTGAPWLTLKKAINTVSINGGDTILMGAGTYAENIDYYGTVAMNRTFLNWTIIQSESGVASDVVLQGINVGYPCFMARPAASYFKWRYVTFGNLTQELTYNLGDISAGSCNNIAFEYCVFAEVLPASVGHTGIGINASGTMVISNISFVGCTFTTIGANAGILDALQIVRSADGATLDVVTLTNNILSTNGYALCAQGVSNIAISGGSYISTGASYGIELGIDGATGRLVSGSITNVTVSTGGHAILLGGGCDGVTVTNPNIICGQYALVIKGANCTVTSPNIVADNSASSVTVLYQGATNCIVTNGRINGQSSYAVGWGGIVTNVGNGNQFTHNRVTISAGGLMHWTYDGTITGIVCDYNTYSINGPTTWGDVRSASPTSLASLRAAWAGYGDGSNDSHSNLEGGDGGVIAAFMLLRRRR